MSALLGCSADIYLHFNTFPSFPTFKMAEKSLTHWQAKHKKQFWEKRKTSIDFRVNPWEAYHFSGEVFFKRLFWLRSSDRQWKIGMELFLGL